MSDFQIDPTKWSGYGQLNTTEGVVQSHRASLDTTPALDAMSRKLGAAWVREDRGYMAIYVVRHSTADGRESFEVGGVVQFRHVSDGALLYAAIVATVAGPQATAEAAIALSLVNLSGIRLGETLVGGEGLHRRQREAAIGLLAAHGHLLDGRAWVQVPYQTRGGRNGRRAKIALRQWTVKELRQPEKKPLRLPYVRISGLRLSRWGQHEEWRSASATVRSLGVPGKVEVGRYSYTVRQGDGGVELVGPSGQIAWKFGAADFARLVKKAPEVMPA